MEFFIAIKGNNAVRTQEHHPSNFSSRKVTVISEKIVLIKSDFLHYDEEVLSWLARVLRAADSIYSPMPSGFLLFSFHLSHGILLPPLIFHGTTQVFYPDLSSTLDSKFLSLSPHNLHCAPVPSSPELNSRLNNLFAPHLSSQHFDASDVSCIHMTLKQIIDTRIAGILSAPHPKFTITLLNSASQLCTEDLTPSYQLPHPHQQVRSHRYEAPYH